MTITSDTAICTRDNYQSGCMHCWESLYQDENGKFYFLVCGGDHSIYARASAKRKYLDIERVKEWASYEMSNALYEQYFHEPKKAAYDPEQNEHGAEPGWILERMGEWRRKYLSW